MYTASSDEGIRERPEPTGSRELQVQGHLDSAEDGHFHGWVADGNDPKSTLEIELWVGERMLTRAAASKPRPDVAAAGFPGDHGFDFYFDPVDAEQGARLRLLVRTKGDEGKRGQLSIEPEMLDAVESYMLITSNLSVKLAETPNVILFDVEDLFSFLYQHNSVTGIQRVVGGIIQVALDGGGSRNEALRFCMVGEQQGLVRIFDEAVLAEVVDLAMLGGTPLQELQKKVMYLKRRAATYRAKAGDIFFIAGAYWIVPDFGVRLNALKQAGVVVGTYIYDLIPITSPQWVSDSTRRDTSERAIDIMLLSDFFFTISDYVKNDVEMLLRFEFDLSRSVTTIPLPHVLPPRRKDASTVRESMLGLGPFVLCVCTLEERKNHMLLFRVWSALLRKQGFAVTPDLVLVGKWGWNIQTLQQALASTDFLSSKVKLFDNIGDVELAYLYDRCMFTIFPSFIEGWGLPVGESLSAGKLCVASKTSSIPEVGGEFCDYIDPHDFYQAYQTIEHAIVDEDYLASRNRSIVGGFEPRSWPTYVESLLSALSRESDRLRTSPAEPLVMQIEPMVIYEISENALVLDQTSAWPSKALKFALASGWSSLERWGCWTTMSEAVFNLAIPATLKLRQASLLIELRSAPGITGETCATLGSGSLDKSIRLHDSPGWFALAVDAGSSKISISIRAHFDPVVEPNRTLFIGMSRFMLVGAENASDASGAAIPLSALRAIGILG